MSGYDPAQVMENLLRQHEASLKMYLVCRLGTSAHLSQAYGAFRDALGQGDEAALLQAPSLVAYAYHLARTVAMRWNPEPQGLQSVAWMPSPVAQEPGYLETLDRIRQELDPTSSEAIELRYARHLSADDAAYVMGVAPGELSTWVERALRRIETWQGGLSDAAPALVADAFRANTDERASERPRAAASMPRMPEGTVIGGRFEIASAAQVAASSSVSIATDVSVPGHSVVVHLLHVASQTTAARTGMMRKVQLLQSVVHPGVGRILDAGWHGERLWFATPLYHGQTLAQLVEQGPLSMQEAIEIFTPVAKALAALHDAGVVHRDLTLDKILLLRVGSEQAPEDYVTVVGFDVWFSGEPPGEDQSSPIAPEVARRLVEHHEVGAPASAEDVFAFGLALLGALDPGAVRTQGAWSERLKARASQAVPVPKSARVSPFGHILARCLALDPQERPRATTLASALEKRRPAALARRARQRRWAWVSIAALTLSLFAVAWYVRQSRSALIQESLDALDATVLREELQAERERAKVLEAELDEPSAR